jgi:hypothetical protein
VATGGVIGASPLPVGVWTRVSRFVVGCVNNGIIVGVVVALGVALGVFVGVSLPTGVLVRMPSIGAVGIISIVGLG